MQEIDLTGGEVKVIGNHEDVHLFRLSNPEGETIIETGGVYEADFISHLGSPPSSVELDITEVATGTLILPVTIITGIYRVRRTDPRRTLLIVEVEAQRTANAVEVEVP